TSTDTFKLAGDYTHSTWSLATDGSGGTLLADQPAASGTATIDTDTTLQIIGASAENVTFAGSTGTLVLSDPAEFTGTISAASGSLSSNDRIDLTNISYSTASIYSITYSSSTNTTTLVVTDGKSADTIKLAGNYTINTSWNFASDGHGGTLVFDPPATPSHQDAIAASGLAIEHAQIATHTDNLGLNFDAALGAGHADS